MKPIDAQPAPIFPPISVQLWSVSEAMKQDFRGTLAALAEAGFDAVEFAQFYGPYENDPQGLKDYLDSLGLAVSGVHIATDLLKGPQQQHWLDYFSVLGTDLVIIPADDRAWDAGEIDLFVADLNALAPVLAEQGFTLMYHNHAMEFDAYMGSTFWDYIAQNIPEFMGLQLDVGWVNFAGYRPVDYVRAYPGRTLSTHIKIRTADNSGVNTLIGQTDFDWRQYAQVLVEVGGAQWLVLEQEEYPEGYSPLQAVIASRQGLQYLLESNSSAVRSP